MKTNDCKACVLAGTFDPITIGHMDIIQRATRLFDQVYVVIMVNANKETMFTLAERAEQVAVATAHMQQVHVDTFTGLLVDYCKKINCYTLIRGVRNGTDFDYEMQQVLVNCQLLSQLEVILLPTKQQLMHVTSSAVRELIHCNANVDAYLPLTLSGFKTKWTKTINTKEGK